MKRTTLWVSSLTLLAASLAGCVSDFTGTVSGKGSAVFCVQDDPTVNFNGVFVNFGNIQINQNTSGNNTINDNDTTGDDTMATSASATMETGATGNDTNTTSTATTTEATTQATTDTATATETVSTTETVAQGGPSSVQTISVDDIDCGRVEAEGAFDGVFRGQAGGAGDDKAESCAPENPGCIADDRRGRSDSPCDRDQGFGNDDKASCESIDVEAGDVDVLQFKDREAAFLAQSDLDPGTIEDVCLTVEDVRVVKSDGQEVNVDIEGGDLCLDGPIVIEEGKHTLVVFKVDVDNSFAGSTEDRIVFSPVIKVQAAAPVTTTITVQETVTQTSVATGNQTTETMTTTDTANATATATASPTDTAAPTTTETAANSTATTTAYSSSAPTTTGP